MLFNFFRGVSFCVFLITFHIVIRDCGCGMGRWQGAWFVCYVATNKRNSEGPTQIHTTRQIWISSLQECVLEFPLLGLGSAPLQWCNWLICSFSVFCVQAFVTCSGFSHCCYNNDSRTYAGLTPSIKEKKTVSFYKHSYLIYVLAKRLLIIPRTVLSTSR